MFPGNPDALVFHIPQKFFDCLQQRMSVGVGGRKKRLPNMTTSFETRDALPLGNFMKYTWQLTNLLHVKQIFDTRQVCLTNTEFMREQEFHEEAALHCIDISAVL
jgi:hypothetical protein